MWSSFNRKQWILCGGIGTVIVLLIFGGVYTALVMGHSNSVPLNEVMIISQSMDESMVASESSVVESESQPVFLYVDVKGAVVHPNVYQLPLGARVVDAVQAAGGYTALAAVDTINQAQLLTDQMMLYVPTQEEVQDREQELGGGVSNFFGTHQEQSLEQEAIGKVNINTATEAELTELSGIGAKKAQAIIEYRQVNGSFQSVEQLQEVKGIGLKLFERIKDQVVVQ